jgi:glycosyltransferase involved in cell wall biosynthesis
LRNHEERGSRLHFLDDLDDAGLEEVYRNCQILLAASWDEGFGLPLIEGSRRGLQVLARDIPVFREVAGDNAVYFQATDSRAFVEELSQMLSRDRGKLLCQAGKIPWLTWEESTKMVTAPFL